MVTHISENERVSDVPMLRKSYINLTLVMQRLAEPAECSGTDRIYAVRVIRNPETYTCVQLATDAPALVGDLSITPFDRAVLDAAYTLLVYNCDTFSVDTLVRVVYGDPHMEVTAAKRRDVQASVDRLRHIGIAIDWTMEHHARTHGKDSNLDSPTEPVCYTSLLLPANEVWVRRPGDPTLRRGLHVFEKPAPYRYAEEIHQIASVPMDRMRIPGIQSTSRTMLIQRYLEQRIAIIGNRRNSIVSSYIAYLWYDRDDHRYRGLLPYLGVCSTKGRESRQTKMRVHQTVTAILDHYVTCGYIAGYTVRKEQSGGQTCRISGVDLHLAKSVDSRQKSVDSPPDFGDSPAEIR